MQERGEDADEREKFARLGVGELKEIVREEAGANGKLQFSTKRRGTFKRLTHVRVNSAPARVARHTSGFDRHARTQT